MRAAPAALIVQEALLAELPGGWRLVVLAGEDDLRRERALMGHGIGEYAYDGRIHREQCRFLSLRDAANQPQATLAVTEGQVMEFMGRPGGVPAPACAGLLRDVFQERGWVLAVPAARLGHVIDTSGQWHALDSLPASLSVAGDLDLRETSIRRLPASLRVGGSLLLDHAPIEHLPDDLVVGGHLRLVLTPIKRLPDALTVGGSLLIRLPSLKALPGGLRVGGTLHVSGLPLRQLPGDMVLGGGLRIERCPMAALPDGLHVRGDLSLLFCHLKALPKDLSVDGNLSIKFCDFLKRLPEDLSVGGDLEIVGTPIVSLPEGVSLGGSLKLPRGAAPELPASIGEETIIVSDFGRLSAAEYRTRLSHSAPEVSPTKPGHSW